MTVLANFTSYIGEDVSLPVTIYSNSAETTLQDISGWSVSFTANLLGGPAAVTETTANGGIVLTTPASGLLTVTIPAAATANLAQGMYCFRIERTNAGGDAVLTEGTWFLLQK